MRIHAILSGIIVLTISFVSGDKIGPRISCTNETVCRSIRALPSDAFCDDGYCMCPDPDSGSKICSSVNASLHQHVPRGAPLVYRTCKHDQDCAYFQGVCNTTNNQCDCAKGYVPLSNKKRCVEVIRSMNASCIDKNQCIAFLANTTCAENKTCVCESGYRYENNTCLKIAEYGQPCAKNEECPYIEGVICVNNTVCECRSGTVLSANGEKCLPAVENISDNCTESVQCAARFQHSNCTGNTCRCEPDYHYTSDPDQCVLTRAIDEDCANEYECYQAEDDMTNDPPSKSLTCAASKCTCAADYYRQENRCVYNGSSVAASLPVYVFIFVSLITLICESLFS